MVYSAFGKILTLTLEAHVRNIAYQAYAQLFQQFTLPLEGVFNTLIFKGKSVRFQQRMKVLFANWFFKVFLKVQCSKYYPNCLFVCLVARPLTWELVAGVGAIRGESLRFWEMKLMIRTRREIRFGISCSIYLQNPKSGLQNLNPDFPI